MPKCAAKVPDRHGWRSHPCTRNGRVQRGDDWYCNQHDPDARRAKQGASYAKYRLVIDYKLARGALVAAALAGNSAKLEEAIVVMKEAAEKCSAANIPAWKYER